MLASSLRGHFKRHAHVLHRGRCECQCRRFMRPVIECRRVTEVVNVLDTIHIKSTSIEARSLDCCEKAAPVILLPQASSLYSLPSSRPYVPSSQLKHCAYSLSRLLRFIPMSQNIALTFSTATCQHAAANAINDLENFVSEVPTRQR